MVKKISVFLLSLCAIACSNGEVGENVLWYESPASCWEEALPVGNGRLGAMVFGNTGTERIQFNENTLYSGEPEADFGIDVTGDLDKVRRLLAAGKNAEAGELMQKKWVGRLNEAYQPFGDVILDFGDSEGIAGYRHSLDMEKAVVTTSYTKDGVGISRKVFASYPAQAIVIRIEAEKPVLDFTAEMSSLHPVETVGFEEGITMKGQAPAHAQRRSIAQMREYGTERLHPEYFDRKGNVIREDHVIYGDGLDGKGTFFESQLVPLDYKGGSVSVENGKIKASGCSEVTLLLYAATSFNGYDRSPSREGKDPHAEIERHKNLICADAASGKAAYRKLAEAHEKDFGSLFNRVELALPSPEGRESLPTDKRLMEFGASGDQGLIAQLFQFGRYLMISSSREGGKPSNLQGLWNDKILPPWNSGYTLNINLEMNYWPAEVCNLSECHTPLFGLIEEIAEKGGRIAEDMYGADGWVIHHNISQWREGYPSDGFVYWFFWNMSGPWLCSHIWEHYLYTGDAGFLKEYYPLMKGSAEFFCDWLVESGDGRLVTPVSTSPENAYLMPDGTPASVCEGSTMDMAVLRNLFSNTVSASEILGEDEEFRNLLADKLSRLQDYRIGSNGQILEWDKEYGESEPQHRHVSHLFGLYPGNDITPDRPELFGAARKSLEMRGSKTTGWSMAWKMSQWARLLDGQKSYEALSNLINYIDAGRKNAENSGGLYRNLLNALPFQIDGNFGFTAGVAEMLLQSHRGNIHLLPALPREWDEGHVSGLKARGGFTVSVDWNADRVKATITSRDRCDVNVVYGDNVRILSFPKEGSVIKVSFER